MVDHPDHPDRTPSRALAEPEGPPFSENTPTLDPKASQGFDDWMATGNENITIVCGSPGTPLAIMN